MILSEAEFMIVHHHRLVNNESQMSVCASNERAEFLPQGELKKIHKNIYLISI